MSQEDNQQSIINGLKIRLFDLQETNKMLNEHISKIANGLGAKSLDEIYLRIEALTSEPEAEPEPKPTPVTTNKRRRRPAAAKK